ncbi:MAG: hypothetical protein K0U37_00360 [Gammaproteobacteria bacterium]|nr:hypothetical protein [Gammaproteobacteria bacterium]
MPKDLNDLHALLTPTSVELCPDKPNTALTEDREIQVWKGNLANTWHFRTLSLGEVYEGTFDETVDRAALVKLNMLHGQNSALRTVNITHRFNRAMHSLNRPYIKLSYAQQTELLATYQGLDVFNVDVDAETRKEACLAILNNRPAAASDSEVLKDLRDALTLAHLNVAGGNAERFLSTRAETTPAEMLQFIHRLLAVTANDLGHAGSIAIPAAPADFNTAYQGIQPDANPDMLGAFPELFQNLFSGGGSVNFHIDPQQGNAIFTRTISEKSVALDRFELALDRLKRGLPEERRETPDVQNCLNEMRAAANTWISGSRDIKALLIFRQAGDKFIQNPIIQHHHNKSDFFGSFESDDLKHFRAALRELRDYSYKRQQLKKEAEWGEFFDIYMVVMPLMAVYDSISMANPLPLCVLVGFSIPLYLNIMHGLILAGHLWEMPWEAAQEYIEASRDLWSRIPLLLSGAAVGGAFLGLCAGLLIPGAEISLMVSTWLAISLVSSTMALLLPIAVVLLGKGIYAGGKAVYDAAFAEGKKDTEAEVAPSCSV